MLTSGSSEVELLTNAFLVLMKTCTPTGEGRRDDKMPRGHLIGDIHLDRTSSKLSLTFFFSCIAGRVRDMVGQLLEF